MSRELIEELIKNYGEQSGKKLFPYLYSAVREEFDEEKDSVFYSGPNWDMDEPVAAIEAFLTGSWLCSGEKVIEFEEKFSEKFGFKKSVMVNSGSSANLVMISALKTRFEWNDGDEVITSAVGFPTTVAPLMQNDLVPVLADIAMSDLNFDLDDVEARITDKTKAIFISPVLANPPNMDRLVEISEKHNVMLVLDDCDSLGSKWKDKYLSDYCVASSCSFYPAHHITTGEGGMVSSNDTKLISIAKSFATWGRACFCVGKDNLSKDGACKNRYSKWLKNYDRVIDHRYIFANAGYNLKPLDLQGAMGIEQLKKFDACHEKRRVNKKRMEELFTTNIPGVKVPDELPDAETGWFAVPIICESYEQKMKLVDLLESNRIQTRNYFAGNLLLHPAYEHLGDFNEYPNSNKVLDQVFFVGCHPSYNDLIFNYVEKILKKF